MSLTAGEHCSGLPFEDEFTDPELADGELRTVRMQVAALLELRRPETFVELVRLARGRRGREVVDGEGRPVVQFDVAPAVGAQGGHPALVAVTELLVRIDRLPRFVWAFQRAVLWVLATLRLIPFRILDGDPALSGKVVRLRSSRAVSLRTARRVLRLLRLLLLTASLSYCVTTASMVAPSGVHKPKKSATKRQLALRHNRSAEPPRPDWGTAAIRVAVIDTGLTDQTRNDDGLKNVEPAHGATDKDPLNVFPLPRPDSYLDLAAGHGTFAAGIIRRVVQPARLDKVAIRVYRAADSDGFAFEYDIAAAMLRAVDEGAQLINLSCCARTVDDRPALALQAAVELLAGRAIVVAATGNLGGTFKMWPAAFAEDAPAAVVAVSALRPASRTAPPVGALWANHGSWVTMSTIGEGIRSTFVEGTAQDPPEVYGPDPFTRWSGTSFSAPQVTGAIARLAADKVTGPSDETHEALVMATAQLHAIGNPLPGYGRALYILPGLEV